MADRDGGIRSLERGLRVLEQLNSRDGARLADLARALDLPRTTIYRILETLEELRYVERSASDSRFRVTDRVNLLARGSTTRTRLASVSGPVISRLGKQISWPLDVTIYRGGAMHIQETTNSNSPMSMSHNMIGVDLPVLRTATGRVILSFSTAKEREAILALVRARNEPEDVPYLRPEAIEHCVRTTRERGYAIRTGESALPTSSSDRTSSIAVPISAEGKVVGALVLIWITSAVTMADALDRYLTPLRDAADEISKALAAK